MRIGEHQPRTVVFVGTEAGGRFIPLGTGFLVSIVHREIEFVFLATAAHVVDSVMGSEFSVRANRKAGGCDTVKIRKTTAILHSDHSNDLVIFPSGLRPDIYDIASVALDPARVADYREKWQPFLGDEVVAIGLYTSHYGYEKNVPVVRIGHIAAMPDEPVMTDVGSARGYLVEMRSIGGLSGSPVYSNPPEVVVIEGQIAYRDLPLHVPIGMMVGYHVVETAEDQISVPKVQGDKGEGSPKKTPDELHTGFAVVIPIERVIELMEGEIVTRACEEVAERHYAKD